METNFKWRNKSYGGKFGHGSFVFLLKHFGLRPAYALLFFVALYFICFKKNVYKESARYLKRALKPKKFTLFFHVYLHIYSFGKTLIDKWACLYKLGNIQTEDTISESIKAEVKDAGFIITSAHFGAWDLASNLINSLYGKDVYLLGQLGEDEETSKVLEKNRKLTGAKVIDQSTDKMSSLTAYMLLKKSSIIVMQGDRDIGGRTALVDFLGAKVQMPLTAFILAQKASVKIYQLFCVRIAPKKYKNLIFSFENIGSATPESLVQAYADNLAKMVQDYPYQWFNFYDFFNEEN